MATATHVKTRCPNPECGREFSVKPEFVGKTATCKGCGNPFILAEGVGRAKAPRVVTPAPDEAAIPFAPDESRRARPGRRVAIVLSAVGVPVIGLCAWMLVHKGAHSPRDQSAEASARDEVSLVLPPSKPVKFKLPTEAAAQPGDKDRSASPAKKGQGTPRKPDYVIGPEDGGPLVASRMSTGEVTGIMINEGETLLFGTQDKLDHWYNWTKSLNLFSKKPTVGVLYVYKGKQFIPFE